MTTLRRGDVVLVPFDFSDRTGTKWRPAVVISSDEYNRLTPDILIASITSNLRALPHPGDHVVEFWREAGLPRESLAQMNVATIESTLILRRLGRLSDDDLASIDNGLRRALELS